MMCKKQKEVKPNVVKQFQRGTSRTVVVLHLIFVGVSAGSLPTKSENLHKCLQGQIYGGLVHFFLKLAAEASNQMLLQTQMNTHLESWSKSQESLLPNVETRRSKPSLES
jgi:hypothetical protein